MIRISRKHIAALFLQPLVYVAAHAVEENKTVEVSIPVVVIATYESSPKSTTCELRDESKDKPLEFSAGVDMSIAYDMQNGTSYSSKFSPVLIKKDKGVDRTNGFMGAYFGLQKTINIFGSDLKFIFTLEKEEGKNSIEFNTYGVENEHMRFGKFAGNFNTYLPGAFRYGAKQFAFKQDLGNGFSYTIGLEEAQETTINKKEFDPEKSKAEKTKAKVTSTDKGEITVFTTEDEKDDKDKLHTSTRIPRLALVPNFTYKQDWGNIQFSALVTATEYYNGKKDSTPTKHEYATMFGAALSGKYIVLHNDDFVNKEEIVINAHVKYLDGLGGYQREVGGVPEDINPNFCLNKEKTKIEANLKSIGGSVSYKQVWTKYLSSSFSANFMKLLNSEKIVEPKEKYDNAVAMKLTPISFNIAKNFSVAPSYSFSMNNILPKKGYEKKNIQRYSIALSYDL